jgi:hypothetical protein
MEYFRAGKGTENLKFDGLVSFPGEGIFPIPEKMIIFEGKWQLMQLSELDFSKDYTYAGLPEMDV